MRLGVQRIDYCSTAPVGNVHKDNTHVLTNFRYYEFLKVPPGYPKLVFVWLYIYSELSLRRTPSGPALTVRLKKVSGL